MDERRESPFPRSSAAASRLGFESKRLGIRRGEAREVGIGEGKLKIAAREVEFGSWRAGQVAVESGEEGVTVRLTVAVACPDFTVRVAGDRPAHQVHVGDRPLRRLPDGDGALEPDTWRRTRDGIVWCAGLPATGLTVSVS